MIPHLATLRALAAAAPSPPAGTAPASGAAALRRRFAALTTPVAHLLAGPAEPQEPPAPRPATTLVAVFESTLSPEDTADLIRRTGIAAAR